ncbi:hypothetical protein PP742_gp52 [Alcaligenes phage vB_Af_QDWS595]|uniref:Uncharacterized protein n=1 Tax=Alcaligenes phage vB_Af_QDWS595 TaxID=2877946 RepID=A0AAE8Y698_9CAUD|nr:hypothetical protein PP742_gp52 [Alcaligenes phage vB_Af_QDWS595]UCR75536.1 hypothetical protein vBAfaPQDWS595_52 [Alcaligenes phage vB_Af_QDWS595]
MILHVLCGIYYLSSDSHIAWKILNLFCGFAFLLATTSESLFRGFVDGFIRILMVTLFIVDVIITILHVPVTSHELRSFVQQICVISFVYLSMCFDPKPPKKKESLKPVLT